MIYTITEQQLEDFNACEWGWKEFGRHAQNGVITITRENAMEFKPDTAPILIFYFVRLAVGLELEERATELIIERFAPPYAETVTLTGLGFYAQAVDRFEELLTIVFDVVEEINYVHSNS